MIDVLRDKTEVDVNQDYEMVNMKDSKAMKRASKSAKVLIVDDCVYSNYALSRMLQ